MESFARNGLKASGIAAGYFACAMIGTLLSVPPSGFAIIWPATAFLIAVMLQLPRRHWWLCAGVIPIHYALAALFQPDASPLVATIQVAGNLLLAAATVVAVRAAIGDRPPFTGFRPVLAFVLIGALAVPAVVNALILGAHLTTGWTADFWLSWGQWMIAGIFPTVTIPPLILLAARGRLTGRKIAPRSMQIELAALAVLLFALGYFGFGETIDTAHWPALYLTPLPFLLWAAVRFGVGGTSAALLALASAIIVQALRREGPFGAHAPIEDVTSLQVFLTAISIPLVLLAALIDERRHTTERLSRSEAWMKLAAASTDVGLWQWDVEAQRLWMTDHCRRLVGLPDPVTPEGVLGMVHPDDRTRFAEAIGIANSANTRRVEEFRMLRDGETRWFGMVSHIERDKAGRHVRVSGALRDVSDRVNAEQEAERLRQMLVRLQEDEHRRIAEELHDSTAQHLVAANLNLMNLKGKTSPEPRELVEDIQRLIGEATAEIRTFSFLLHPQQLSDEGLTSVLEAYVPGFERRTGIESRLRVNPIVDQLPTEQQHALLRITQESLGNVHRHAGAKRASIQLRHIGDVIHLVVRDDGEGIPAEAGKRLSERLRLGVGIPAMNARVRQLGGRLDVNSRRKGTTIHVAIPFRRSHSEAA